MSLLSLNPTGRLIALAVLLAGTPAGAAEYSAEARVDSEVYYDSNIVLRTKKEEVGGIRLAPRLNLRARGGSWQTDLNTTLIFNRLSNDLYDSDDQVVGVKLRKFSEKQAWQLEGEVRRESTRSAVLELGSVPAATRTERRSLRPSWSRVFNEKNSLAVGGSWLEAEYDSFSFTDFEQYGFDATWTRQLNERLDIQTALYNSSFETDDLESDTVGLTVALARQFDEQLSGSFRVGARQVETMAPLTPSFFCLVLGIGCPATTDSNGFTAAADVTYEGDNWNGSLSFSRSLNPDAFSGELLESDRFAINYSRALRPRVFFDFEAELYSDNSLDNGSNFGRDRWFVTPAIRWQFAERWSFSTTLRHRIREQLEGTAETIEAEATAIFFKVRYSHPRASW